MAHLRRSRGDLSWSIRPRLEALENRWCPSIVYQFGATLFVLGDQGANEVAIVDSGTGDVSVAADGGDPRTFSRVGEVVVLTDGGDDIVNYQVGNPDFIGNPEFHPAAFMMDFGDGSDRGALIAYSPTDHSGTGNTWTGNVRAGTGDDIVTLNGSGFPAFALTFDFGAGNDMGIFGIIDDNKMPVSEELALSGDTGNDDIRVTCGIIDDNKLPAPAVETAAAMVNVPGVTVNVDGGQGQDAVQVDYHFSVTPGPSELPPGPCRIALNTFLRGGTGDDELRVTFAHDFPLDRRTSPEGTVPAVVLAAPVIVDMSGDQGNDMAILLVGPETPAALGAAPLAVSDFRARLDG